MIVGQREYYRQRKSLWESGNNKVFLSGEQQTVFADV